MNIEKKLRKECPICHELYTRRSALSRRDNKTHICPDCGTDEAMEDLKNGRA